MKLETWFTEEKGKRTYCLRTTTAQYPEDPFIETFDTHSELVEMAVKKLINETTGQGTNNIEVKITHNATIPNR